MKKNEIFFSKLIPMVTVFGSLCLICDFANAATRATNPRSVPSTRKNISATIPVQTTTQKTETDEVKDVVTPTIDEQPEILEPEPELILSNKSGQFEDVVSAVMETALPDNSFAEEIRRQRAALAASESSYLTNTAQSKALSAGVSSCDVALRKCMMQSCGKDFTKCATDGDTMFGEKLNRCRRDTECSAQEFNAFGNEIKADRDVNVKLASYDAVINCGNSYNACIVNECGTTYNKCLGKTAQDAAVQKCAVIAKECIESDSGLSARFGVAIGKLRENAEKDVKSDESRLYALRDMMAKQCNALGASFDERSFDCVYSIEFYVGENQSVPLASRMAYAGDSFVCTQEWFGINTTTTMENAYRETRAQTGASSAMLGSGLGTAAGLISSGAINRALDTQKAKKALNEAETTKQNQQGTNNESEKAKTTERNKSTNEKQESSEKESTDNSNGATVIDNNGTVVSNTIKTPESKSKLDMATQRGIDSVFNEKKDKDAYNTVSTGDLFKESGKTNTQSQQTSNTKIPSVVDLSQPKKSGLKTPSSSGGVSSTAAPTTKDVFNASKVASTNSSSNSGSNK